jgi:hypothetical protein
VTRVPVDTPIDLGGLDDVERRGGPRGPVSAMMAVIGDLPAAPVVEAGTKALFVELPDPDILPLGVPTECVIIAPTRRAHARVDVIRKEIAPRRGVALLIVSMSPADEEAWQAMLHP